MAYHTLDGRDVNPWIDHFKQQANSSFKRREKDGILLLSTKGHAAKDKHAIPIQNVSPVEQVVSQAKAELKEEKSIRRRAAGRKSQSKKRRHPRKTSSPRHIKKKKAKLSKKAKNKDIFNKHGRTNRRAR